MCAQAANSDPVTRLFYECQTPGELCCFETLGGKQIALCDVPGCCMRIMPNHLQGQNIPWYSSLQALGCDRRAPRQTRQALGTMYWFLHDQRAL
jgi:hypothetical protein